jgi:hypothetical protein
MTEGQQQVVDYAEIKGGSGQIAQALADARSARHLISRRKRQEERDDRAAEGVRRRRKAVTEREADEFLRRRLRVHVSKTNRPRAGSATPRRLFTRQVSQMLKGATGFTDARGPDGRHSVHYSFTARGLGSRRGRRWRDGESARAALYSVREEALEDGELGWWSNIAADRNELVAHYRASEALEKHDRANANVYIVEVIALPAELTAEQRRTATQRLCRGLEKQGLAYTVGIHLPDAAGDQRNYHLHLIYSMRPCQRVAPYEWEFGTTKVTEINTPKGILQRRCGVVVAINETLREAGVAKRYTPLSHRERGLAPPARGKIGQKETAMARRIAALEARQARLALLQAHLRWLRQTLLDTADRYKAARIKVTRRLIITKMAIDGHEADRITPAEVRDQVKARLQRVSNVAEHQKAAVQLQRLTALHPVRKRLGSAVPQGPIVDDRRGLDGRREELIRHLDFVAMRSAEITRQLQNALEERRAEMAAITKTIAASEAALDEAPTQLRQDAQTNAADVRAAMAAKERGRPAPAARKITEKFVDDGTARDEAGLIVADTAGLTQAERQALERQLADGPVQDTPATLFAGQQIDAPITSPEPGGGPVGHEPHHQHSKKEHGYASEYKGTHKRLPRRRSGLRAISGLASLRVLRPFNVDDRPAEAAGVLRDTGGTDLRAGRGIHLEVRGPSNDRVIEKSDHREPERDDVRDRPTTARKGGLFAQAEALRGQESDPLVRPKGSRRDAAGDDDRPWPYPGRGGRER